MADPSCQGASPPVHDVLRSAYHLLDTSRGLDATCSRGEELARRAAECRACIAGVAGVLAALGDPEADALASCEAMRPGGTLAAGRGDGGQQDDPPGLLRAQEAAGAAARGASDPMDTSTHDSAAEPPAGAGASPGDRAAAGPDQSGWQAPPHSVPIHANVITFDWSALSAACQFDVVVMDPPWQLATANPTRGVALGYSQLSDADIAALPVPALQPPGGLLFVWVINAKFKFTLDLFDLWGYELVDEIAWVKTTVNRRLFKSHGYYLQHAKEACLVGRRLHPASGPGEDALDGPAGGAGGGGGAGGAGGLGCGDVIISERRGQSQKPEELYELIEALVPGGRYLEVFARRNNLRDYWVSIGNEVGPGLPESDLRALSHGGGIPGARYGRGAG